MPADEVRRCVNVSGGGDGNGGLTGDKVSGEADAGCLGTASFQLKGKISRGRWIHFPTRWISFPFRVDLISPS